MSEPGPGDPVVAAPARLVPRWFVTVVVGGLTLFALGMLALALADDGVMGWSAWGLFAAGGLVPESITYRGYRTDQTWPWSKVRGARIRERGPAEQLIEEIRRARAAGTRQ